MASCPGPSQPFGGARVNTVRAVAMFRLTETAKLNVVDLQARLADGSAASDHPGRPA